MIQRALNENTENPMSLPVQTMNQEPFASSSTPPMIGGDFTFPNASSPPSQNNPFSSSSTLRIQDLSPLRNLKQQRQTVGSPQHSQPLNITPSKQSQQTQQQSTPQKRQSPKLSSCRKTQIIHSRSRAFEKSPEGSQFYRINDAWLMDALNSPLENKENEMEISPGNESSPKSPNLEKTQPISPYRKVLSPISPNQLMEDSPSNNNTINTTPSNVCDLQRKKPSPRYSPYMVNSPQQTKSSLRNAHPSPLLKFATTTGSQKKKSPLHLQSSLVKKTNYHRNASLKRNPSPKANAQSSSTVNHPNNNMPVTMKPIQFEPPTSSANDCSPVIHHLHDNSQTTLPRSQTFVQSPFKTPSYYKKRQALAEDLSLAYEDTYSRTKKNPSFLTPSTMKNPFTSPLQSNHCTTTTTGNSSVKHIHVIPEKAYKMMVGNTQQQMKDKFNQVGQQSTTAKEQQSKKKSLIRSMKDYRKTKLESLKNKLREQRTFFTTSNHQATNSGNDAHREGYSSENSHNCTNMESMPTRAQQASSSFSSTGSDKKKSPARKRKYDETDENLQGGSTMVRSLGVVLTQNQNLSHDSNLVTLHKTIIDNNALDSMMAQSSVMNSMQEDNDDNDDHGMNHVESSDEEDEEIKEEEIHKTVESPTKKLKSEQGRPLWSRLKKALTRKSNALNESSNENSKSISGSQLKRKLSKKSLMLVKQQQMMNDGGASLMVVTSNSASNLISFTNCDTEQPVTHQSTVNVSNQGPLKKQKSFGEHYFTSLVNGFRHKENHSSEMSNSSTCSDEDMKLKNRHFQIQDNLQDKFMNDMKETFSAGTSGESKDRSMSTVNTPFKVPSLNLKGVPPLSLNELNHQTNQYTPREQVVSSSSVLLGESEEEIHSQEEPFSYNFIETIRSPHHREYFIKHCEKEYNSENIEFWCEVRLKYEFLRNRAQRYEHAIKLLNGYVELTSDKAINIDKKSILQVKTRIKDENDELVDLFESITKHIETVMQDAFKRFQLSPLYQEMISHHKQLLEKNSAIVPTSTDLDTPRGAHANFKSKVMNFLSPKGILHH
ncbi:hypothetical protein FDP41_003582 [Naegleria fowleri]|uniref:RGS domain-containing protein n=1 Tax=Naegleria fowleri TaxID=5763 RepID=A0A6A5BV18_NAEFO|nr:uncharacterized protein FDP41_003582 [Naegleria fowleri]KAF0977590.1 hypothetical protein FDP41_003582 [Naegleria fowleri]